MAGEKQVKESPSQNALDTLIHFELGIFNLPMIQV